jgi:hypothetical protein
MTVELKVVSKAKAPLLAERVALSEHLPLRHVVSGLGLACTMVSQDYKQKIDR